MPKQPPPLIENSPRQAVNITLQMIFAATNVPQNFPNYIVPPGLSVSLGGSTGQAANAQNAFVASQLDKLLGGVGRVVLPPSTSAADAVSFPVDRTSQIWAMGTQGDGVQLVIKGTPIG